MKLFCDSCHGYTFDDTRGNCGACGAPRTKPTTHANPITKKYVDALNKIPQSIETEFEQIDVTCLTDERRVFIASNFGNALTPESAAGMNRAAESLRRSQDELNEVLGAQAERIGNQCMPKFSQWIDALKTSA